MICNATPLICLSRINQLELLEKCFREIIIPNAVREEVLVMDKPGHIVFNEALKKGWIKIIEPKEISDFGLGKGENSAISLAKENKDKLIIDDALAIKLAQALNIQTLRTTTVLFMCFEKKSINKKQTITILDKLVDAGYYIAPKYYSALLTKLSDCS